MTRTPEQVRQGNSINIELPFLVLDYDPITQWNGERPVELERRDFLKLSGTALVAAVASGALPELRAMARRQSPRRCLYLTNYPMCNGRVQSFAPKNAILVNY